MDGRPLARGEKFDPERSPFNRRMAEGHQIRKGHTLKGFYVDVPGVAGVVKLVRTCCDSD